MLFGGVLVDVAVVESGAYETRTTTATKKYMSFGVKKCVVTVEELNSLNWCEWDGSVERELKIHRHVLTSSTEP